MMRPYKPPYNPRWRPHHKTRADYAQPETVVRHHGRRWTELHDHVLLLAFAAGEPVNELVRMLGRTEGSVLRRLNRLRVIWYDGTKYRLWSKYCRLFNLPFYVEYDPQVGLRK